MMYSYKTLLVAAAFFLASGLSPVHAQTTPSKLVIDDFSSGPVDIRLSGASQEVQSQSGTMLGGWRQVGYRISQPAGSDVEPGGRMMIIPNSGKVVASQDYNTGHRLSYRYGKGYGAGAPGENLQLDLSSYDQFSVEFEGADLNVTTHVMACSASCAQRAQLGKNIASNQSAASVYQGTTVTLPLKDFKMSEGFDWSNVTLIEIFTQTSNAAASEDFAITEISVSN